MKTIIQIGSHVGNTINDPIFNTINPDDKLILVEPVPYLFRKLKENYKNKNLNNVYFINKAVSDFIGEIELTIPSERNDFSRFPHWASQLASVDRMHVHHHIGNLIAERILVPTTTISEIIHEYDVKEIDFLNTDTEGHDYTILMDYDFKIKPKKILFEHKHMDGFGTVGKNYETLMKRLESLGYVFKEKTIEDTCVELNMSV